MKAPVFISYLKYLDESAYLLFCCVVRERGLKFNLWIWKGLLGSGSLENWLVLLCIQVLSSFIILLAMQISWTRRLYCKREFRDYSEGWTFLFTAQLVSNMLIFIKFPRYNKLTCCSASNQQMQIYKYFKKIKLTSHKKTLSSVNVKYYRYVSERFSRSWNWHN